MKYLVVVQPIEHYKDKEKYCMPLGIAYVNGALRASGLDVDGVNLMFVDKDPYETLYEILVQREYDVLLCGGLSAEFPILKQIYDTAKKANPNIITIGGGGGFSASPILFSELTDVDYAVIGEGEITTVELAIALEQHKNISEIEGVVYKDKNWHHQTPPRLPITDIDYIPFPSYEGLGIEEYLNNQYVDGWYNYFTYYSDHPRLMPMMMSRSCPYMCSFCFHPIGKGYRARSLNNFFKELEMWIEKYQINGIALVDECFSMNPDTVIEFCKRIKPYNIAWACQMRAEIYDYELMTTMKDSGCIGACFGIESMSQSVLDNMQKHLVQETIEKALKVSYTCRVGVTGNLLFGAETENFDTVWESIKWNRRHVETTNHQPINAFIYIQTYPGSQYYKNAVNEGRIPDESEFIREGQWVINNTAMSNYDFGVIEEVARILQHEPRNLGKLVELSRQNNDRLTVTFICPHCGNQHTYHDLSQRHLKEHRIRNLGCRTCNGMAEYLINETFFPYNHYQTIKWLLNKHDFEDKDILKAVYSMFPTFTKIRIGIIGAWYTAEKLVKLLEQTETLCSVEWIMPRKNIDVITLDIRKIYDTDDMEKVDLIINAELVHPEWVRVMLPSKAKATDVEHLIRMVSTFD